MRRARFVGVLVGAALLPVTVIAPSLAVAPPDEGGPDQGWGSAGAVTFDWSATPVNDSLQDLTVAPDDRVVVAGSSNVNGLYQFAVGRLRANGVLDTTFSGDGRTTTAMGSGDAVVEAVKVGPDGRIVVAGYAASTSYNVDAIAVYRPDGSLDTSFSNDGRVFTDWGADSGPWGMAVQPDGKIVTTGFVQTGADTYQLTVARYTDRGFLDGTFGGGDGRVQTEINGQDDEGIAIAVQPDGRIVVGGYSQQNTDYFFVLARFLPSGDPDPSFGGGDGELTTPIGTNDGIRALELMPDGRIVVGGYSNAGGGSGPTLARYLSDGTLDTTFSDDGIVMPADTDVSTFRDLALQPNGRIVFVGEGPDSLQTGAAVARLNLNGRLDTTFDDDGMAVRHVDNGTSGNSIGLQRDGTILAAGGVTSPSAGSLAVLGFIGDLTDPFAGRVIGLSRWSTSLRPTMYWSASDDNTGVKVFDVVQRVAKATSASYGGYSAVKTATQITAGALPGATGRTACVSVRGRDWAGNIGAFGTESCVAFPVDDKDLAKTGSWTGLTGKAYYAGTARRSSANGATLSLAGADYRHLALVATKCTGCGTVKVYRGSTLLATVKLAAGSTKHRVVIPIQNSATVLSGTIKIKIVSTGKPVTIDGLGISLA
jgi:uncharacterized delta-60 repeat protein